MSDVVSGRRAQGPSMSTFPRTAVTGAILARSSRWSFATSPQCRMRSMPEKRGAKCGKIRPEQSWVSEMIPSFTFSE